MQLKEDKDMSDTEAYMVKYQEGAVSSSGAMRKIQKLTLSMNEKEVYGSAATNS